ncbi:MAG: hypothetical protein QNL21_07725 [Flavobacteriales bacterium]
MVQVKYIAISIGLAFGFSSCVKRTDDTPPSIETFFEGETLTDSLIVIAGEELDLTFNLSDDSGLNTARFFISKKSDIPQVSCAESNIFEYLGITELGGNYYEYSPGIIFPDSIVGIYKLEIGVYDDQGNFSDKDFILSIENPYYPIIDSLNSDNIVTQCLVSLSEGNLSFGLNLQASCAAIITEMKTYLYASEILLESQTYTIENSLINDDFNFTVPETGQYELRIELTSSQGVSSRAVLELSASS